MTAMSAEVERLVSRLVSEGLCEEKCGKHETFLYCRVGDVLLIYAVETRRWWVSRAGQVVWYSDSEYPEWFLRLFSGGSGG